MTEVAFKNFEEIQKLDNNLERKREWLKQYEGKKFAIGENRKELIFWKKYEDKYTYYDSRWDEKIKTIKGGEISVSEVNKIQRHDSIFVIEFDDKMKGVKLKDKSRIASNIEKVKTLLEENGIGYIESTHMGNSNYLWIEHENKLSDGEIEIIIKLLSPVGSEVDTNFASSNKRLPVLFAKHWKYNKEEEPIKFFPGLKLNNYILAKIAEGKEVIDGEDVNDKGYKTFKKGSPIRKIFSIKGQVEQYHKLNPFFYDKSKLFWKWDKECNKYSMCDEVDLLNDIEAELEIETIDSKKRVELIESFKQVGRKKVPKKPKKYWVQFLDKVYNGKTAEFLFDVTPEYHFMNPIGWKVGKFEDTPTIDKLFTEWVGKGHEIELSEFIAYLITRDRFLQRIYGLCGGGSNGKGTFIKFCTKFVGKDNCVASELKQLAENQFEPAVLYGKLLCIMGEVSYADLKNTNEIKKIAGEDLMSFQFKGKTPFTEENSAIACCLTNSLPTTPDKSIGFYRKWMIIDFPNQFNGILVDPIETIPDIEFENLALKSLNILKKLYESKTLSNEGDFNERIKRYEERSNPIMQFIEEQCEEISGKSTPLRDFTIQCNEFLKSKHLRVMTANQIGKTLREEGFSVGNRKIDDISQVVILNISIKSSKKLLKLLKLFKS